MFSGSRAGAALLLFVSCTGSFELSPRNEQSAPPPLTLSPDALIVGPRSRTSIAIAGGRAPYRASLVAGSGPLASVVVEGATATYFAGAIPDQIDALTVTDAQGGAVSLSATVGPSFAVAPADVRLAAGATLRFTLSGGQVPYRPVRGRLGALTGLDYVAPPQGGQVDTVTFADSAGVEVAAHVSVVAALGTTSPPAKPRAVNPGASVLLDTLVVDGTPPYRFAFTEEGNASNGTILDRVLTCGDNPNVTDLVQVRDATGATITLGVRVRAPVFPLASRSLLLGDFDGNRVPDVLAMSDSATRGGNLAFLATNIASHPVLQYDVPFGYTTAFEAPIATVLDLDGDSRAELVVRENANTLDTRLAWFSPSPGGPVKTGETLIAGLRLEQLVAVDMDGNGKDESLLALVRYAGVGAVCGRGDIAVLRPDLGVLKVASCFPGLSPILDLRFVSLAPGHFSKTGFAAFAVIGSGGEPIAGYLRSADGSTVTSTVPFSTALPASYVVRALQGADVTGDGYDDLLFVAESPVDVKLVVARSTCLAGSCSVASTTPAVVSGPLPLSTTSVVAFPGPRASLALVPLGDTRATLYDWKDDQIGLAPARSVPLAGIAGRSQLIAADFNGDRRNDLAFATADQVGFLYGDGDGGFEAADLVKLQSVYTIEGFGGQRRALLGRPARIVGVRDDDTLFFGPAIDVNAAQLGKFVPGTGGRVVVTDELTTYQVQPDGKVERTPTPMLGDGGFIRGAGVVPFARSMAGSLIPAVVAPGAAFSLEAGAAAPLRSGEIAYAIADLTGDGVPDAFLSSASGLNLLPGQLAGGRFGFGAPLPVIGAAAQVLAIAQLLLDDKTSAVAVLAHDTASEDRLIVAQGGIALSTGSACQSAGFCRVPFRQSYPLPFGNGLLALDADSDGHQDLALVSPGRVFLAYGDGTGKIVATGCVPGPWNPSDAWVIPPGPSGVRALALIDQAIDAIRIVRLVGRAPASACPR